VGVSGPAARPEGQDTLKESCCQQGQQQQQQQQQQPAHIQKRDLHSMPPSNDLLLRLFESEQFNVHLAVT
jgi:hypothetical protein